MPSTNCSFLNLTDFNFTNLAQCVPQADSEIKIITYQNHQYSVELHEPGVSVTRNKETYFLLFEIARFFENYCNPYAKTRACQLKEKLNELIQEQKNNRKLLATFEQIKEPDTLFNYPNPTSDSKPDNRTGMPDNRNAKEFANGEGTKIPADTIPAQNNPSSDDRPDDDDLAIIRNECEPLLTPPVCKSDCREARLVRNDKYEELSKELVQSLNTVDSTKTEITKQMDLLRNHKRNWENQISLGISITEYFESKADHNGLLPAALSHQTQKSRSTLIKFEQELLAPKKILSEAQIEQKRIEINDQIALADNEPVRKEVVGRTESDEYELCIVGNEDAREAIVRSEQKTMDEKRSSTAVFITDLMAMNTDEGQYALINSLKELSETCNAKEIHSLEQLLEIKNEAIHLTRKYTLPSSRANISAVKNHLLGYEKIIEGSFDDQEYAVIVTPEKKMEWEAILQPPECKLDTIKGVEIRKRTYAELSQKLVKMLNNHTNWSSAEIRDEVDFLSAKKHDLEKQIEIAIQINSWLNTNLAIKVNNGQLFTCYENKEIQKSIISLIEIKDICADPVKILQAQHYMMVNNLVAENTKLIPKVKMSTSFRDLFMQKEFLYPINTRIDGVHDKIFGGNSSHT